MGTSVAVTQVISQLLGQVLLLSPLRTWEATHSSQAEPLTQMRNLDSVLESSMSIRGLLTPKYSAPQ